MEITVKVKIFPDPEYCNNQQAECWELFRGQCQLSPFFSNLEHDFPENGLKDVFKKHPGCKQAYQQAKSALNIKDGQVIGGAVIKTNGSVELLPPQIKVKSPGDCTFCGGPITPENNGIELPTPGFFQCDQCHKEQYGVGIAWTNFYFLKKTSKGNP